MILPGLYKKLLPLTWPLGPPKWVQKWVNLAILDNFCDKDLIFSQIPILHAEESICDTSWPLQNFINSDLALRGPKMGPTMGNLSYFGQLFLIET